MNYEIKKAIIVEDEKGNERIRTMVKIGAIDFAFMSNTIDSSSDKKYFVFKCSDPLFSGACKVVGIIEENITDQVREASLPLFQLTVDASKEVEKQIALDRWASLKFWDFIEDFKAQIPGNCTVSHMTYDRGVERINEGNMSMMDSFPTVSIQTPYNRREIQIEEKQAYTNSGFHSKPSYTYYDVTCGFDEKFGKPRKLENIIKTVLKAIETLKARDERQKAVVKKDKVEKGAVLHLLGKSFVAEEERKYSSLMHRGMRNSWIVTKYKSDFISAVKVREDEFKVTVISALNSDQVNKLNEFLKTL